VPGCDELHAILPDSGRYAAMNVRQPPFYMILVHWRAWWRWSRRGRKCRPLTREKGLNPPPHSSNTSSCRDGCSSSPPAGQMAWAFVVQSQKPDRKETMTCYSRFSPLLRRSMPVIPHPRMVATSLTVNRSLARPGFRCTGHMSGRRKEVEQADLKPHGNIQAAVNGPPKTGWYPLGNELWGIKNRATGIIHLKHA